MTVVLAAACGTHDPRPVEPDLTEAKFEAPPPEPVEQPEFIGVVTTRKSELVPMPFQAKVLSVDVKPGQKIRKGDRIAKLDESELRDQIAGAIADEKQGLASAGADGAAASVARQEATRLYRAYKAGAVSKAAYEAKLGEVTISGSRSGVGGQQAKSARARRETLERQLAQSSVTAPFDGIVMSVKAKEGQVAGKGDALTRLFDPSDLLFRFEVPKEWRKTISEGMRVELKVEGVERPLWATIERIAEQEAPINFAVVDADIDDSKLAPGELTITSAGRVTLADNKPRARKAVR